jgi:hypothetical protein
MKARAPKYTVFLAAEGPSELGDLAREVQWRSDPPREGYLQPMLRKLLGETVAFDGQRITLLGRFEAKKKLKGHADRAAKALALASTVEGCRGLVFAHDVDKAYGQKRSATEPQKRVQGMHDEIEAVLRAPALRDRPHQGAEGRARGLPDEDRVGRPTAPAPRAAARDPTDEQMTFDFDAA